MDKRCHNLRKDFPLMSDLCPTASDSLDVMLSQSEASAFRTASEKAVSSASPQNNISAKSGADDVKRNAKAQRLNQRP
jgi:hypothetical protein